MRSGEGLRVFDRESWQRKVRVPPRFQVASEPKHRWTDERTKPTQGV
jgi:hypothetical protein